MDCALSVAYRNDNRQMDRRFIITATLAMLGACGPPLLAQSNRVAPLRLPRTNAPLAQIERLPAPGPTADPRLVAAYQSPDGSGARPSSPAARRRYPSTARISTPGLDANGTGSNTYRWDPQDANLDAVGKRVEKRIEAGFKLANKGALYGARAEFRKAILAVAEALDAQHGVTSHSQAIHEALLAIKEAADFSVGEASSPGRVQQIVATHQTSVLKQGDIQGMPALLAMQRYYVFAQQRLVAASGGAPVASKAMYAMGKLHMALADSESQNELEAAKAMTFLQAAMMVDASNHAAANELGVMLARFGHLREARDLLRHSARVHPTQETWKNLEIVHQRLGEDQLAERARMEWQRQRSSAPPVVAGNAGTVQWVAPEAFAGPPSGTLPPPAAAPPAAAPSTAEKSSGFSLWPWR